MKSKIVNREALPEELGFWNVLNSQSYIGAMRIIIGSNN